MNVFVLCTGRCGSTALADACEFITNFSSGHETRAGIVGTDRTSFSDNHIEIDNRLAWYLGRIDEEFGQGAYYVHMKRDFEKVVNSYSIRKNFGLMKMFQNGMLIGQDQDVFDDKDLARDICSTIESNIQHFLKDKPNQMEMNLETVQADFEKFWNWIGAEGDYQQALNTFDIPANTTEDLMNRSNNSFPLRAFRKFVRIVKGVPAYISKV